jgi:hypothetical protein
MMDVRPRLKVYSENWSSFLSYNCMFSSIEEAYVKIIFILSKDFLYMDQGTFSFKNHKVIRLRALWFIFDCFCLRIKEIYTWIENIHDSRKG